MFMRKKVIVASLILCSMLCSGSMYALDREKQISLRNEVRVGWGDMLYETAMYHTTWTTNNYRYTGHLFAEYQHWFKRWLSVGVQADYEQVWWDIAPDKATGASGEKKEGHFYNVSLLPTVRFTYFFHPYLNLYSSVYLGMTVNGGTEQDMYLRHTAVTPAWGFTLLGIKAGGEHVFGTLEIGGLNALTNKNLIYMLGSRVFTLSVGYNF